MSLTIRPVDPGDDREMDVLQDLYVEAQRAEVPDARVYSRADSVALLRRLAVKCALTRAVHQHFPDVEYVSTQNAETNAPMVAINEAMGFEIHTIEGEFQKHLAG